LTRFILTIFFFWVVKCLEVCTWECGTHIIYINIHFPYDSLWFFGNEIMLAVAVIVLSLSIWMTEKCLYTKTWIRSHFFNISPLLIKRFSLSQKSKPEFEVTIHQKTKNSDVHANICDFQKIFPDDMVYMFGCVECCWMSNFYYIFWIWISFN